MQSYEDALSLQRAADVLLLIDFEVEEYELRMFFLSKLLDYVLAGKLIVGITGPNSACREFIESGFGVCFDHGDARGLSEFLTALGRNPEIILDRFERKPPPVEFSARYNAIRLAKLIREVALV
jgi:hypothetical protein